MHRLFEGFEKFAVAVQSHSSQLLDAFPVLQYLPTFFVPMRKYAQDLHKDEKALYMNHYLRVKEGIRNGTAKDCFCVEMAKIQKDEGFSDEQASYNAGYTQCTSDLMKGLFLKPDPIPHLLQWLGLFKPWPASLKSKRKRKRRSTASLAPTVFPPWTTNLDFHTSEQ